MSSIIKVDRVKTIPEAEELRDLGVNIVGLSLGQDREFSDERNLSFEEALKIINQVKGIDFSIAFHSDFTHIEAINKLSGILNISYFQVDYKYPLIQNLAEELSKNNFKLVITGFDASYDEDPSWISDLLAEQKQYAPDLLQIDLLPDVENSWEFFTKECPKYPEELQLEDISEMASKYPLLISSGFTDENIIEVTGSISNIKGTYFVLGENQKLGNKSHYIYNKLKGILSANKSK